MKRPVFILSTTGKSKEQVKAEARAALLKFQEAQRVTGRANFSFEKMGRWYYAVPKHGPAQQFRTPYAAMLALDRTNGEGDVWTAQGDGVREHLCHRTQRGEWR